MSALLLHTGADLGVHDLIAVLVAAPWSLVVVWLHAKVTGKRRKRG